MRTLILLCCTSMQACTAQSANHMFTWLVVRPVGMAIAEEADRASARGERRVDVLARRSREELERKYATGPHCWVETEVIDERTWQLKSCKERLVCEAEAETWRCEEWTG